MRNRMNGLFLSGGQNSQLEENLYEAYLGMTKTIGKVPPPIRNILYSARGQETRRQKNLLALFPTVAPVCARFGAPFHEVIQPLRYAEVWLKATYYSSPLPTVTDANLIETQAQGSFDEIQVVLPEMPTQTQAREALSAAIRHRDELNVLIDVLGGLCHKPSLALSA